MYLDGVAMPITPSKIELKIANQNKTMNLIDGTQINLLKEPGLSKASFELLLPNVNYPFSTGGQKAKYYLELFERLKSSKQPFQWIVSRYTPKGGSLFYTNLKMGLEDYQITDDAGKGFDIGVKINLTQWKPYGTKTVTIKAPEAPASPPTATVEPAPREATSAPSVKTYTVVKGDCLWNIAKKFYGNGAKYPDIVAANQNIFAKRSPNLIYAGDVLTIP